MFSMEFRFLFFSDFNLEKYWEKFFKLKIFYIKNFGENRNGNGIKYCYRLRFIYIVIVILRSVSIYFENIENINLLFV